MDHGDLVDVLLREPEVAVRADRDPEGPLSCHSSGNSVIVPLGVMRPIVPRFDSVNQRFPSGPGTIVYERLSACGSGNSVTSARAPGAGSNARPATTKRRSNPRLEHGSHFLAARRMYSS
jgi:hypothetical protein